MGGTGTSALTFVLCLSPSSHHEKLNPPDGKTGTYAQLSFILNSQINYSKPFRASLFGTKDTPFPRPRACVSRHILFVLKLGHCTLISSPHVCLVSDLAHLEIVTLLIMCDHRCAFLVLPDNNGLRCYLSETRYVVSLIFGMHMCNYATLFWACDSSRRVCPQIG